MFTAMMEGIKEESVGNLFNLQVEVQENPIVEEAADGAAAVGSAPPRLPPAGRRCRRRAPARTAMASAPGAARRWPAGGTGAAGPAGPAAARPGRGGGQPGAAQAGRAASPADAGAPVVAPGLSRPQRPGRLPTARPRGRRRPGRSGAPNRPPATVRRGRAQRPVPLRLGPQVQALPRRPA